MVCWKIHLSFDDFRIELSLHLVRRVSSAAPRLTPGGYPPSFLCWITSGTTSIPFRPCLPTQVAVGFRHNLSLFLHIGIETGPDEETQGPTKMDLRMGNPPTAFFVAWGGGFTTLESCVFPPSLKGPKIG